MSQSEVALLRQQIIMEYEAAQRGLCGLSLGTARHDFITTRMENIAVCHTVLQGLIGEDEATKFLAEVFEQPGNQIH